MPLYEYECGRCHRRIEKIQSFSADPLTVCETCGGPLERLISASAFQFKGSGWYATDYAKSGGAVPAPPDKKPDAAPAAAGATDSTPATPAPAKPAPDK